MLKINRDLDTDILKTVLDCGDPSPYLTELIQKYICRQQAGVSALIKLEKDHPALMERGQKAVITMCCGTLYPQEPFSWQETATINTDLFKNTSSILTKYFTEKGFLKPSTQIEITENDFSRILSDSSKETIPGVDPMITGTSGETKEDTDIDEFSEEALMAALPDLDLDLDFMETNIHNWDANLFLSNSDLFDILSNLPELE